MNISILEFGSKIENIDFLNRFTKIKLILSIYNDSEIFKYGLKNKIRTGYINPDIINYYDKIDLLLKYSSIDVIYYNEKFYKIKKLDEIKEDFKKKKSI